MVDSGADGPVMRLDRFLWHARLARTRNVAQMIAEDGHLRIDGRPVGRAAAGVRVGQILTFAAHGQVRILRIDALPARRGPAPEARGCYTDLADANNSQHRAGD